MEDTESSETRYTRVRHYSWDSDTEEEDDRVTFEYGNFRNPVNNYAHREGHGNLTFESTRPGGYAFLKWIETREGKNLLWNIEKGHKLDKVIVRELTTYCIGYRERHIKDDDFAADGAGFRLALIAAEEILSQESQPSLEEFKAWNSEISPTWHNDQPPCACGSRANLHDRNRNKLCSVCYQIQTKLKQPWYLPHSSSTAHPQGLCATCSHIDFNFMFDTNCEPFPLSSLQNILASKDDCNFCCLLGDSLKKHYGEAVQVVVDGHPTICIIGSDLDRNAGFISLLVRFQTISQPLPWLYYDSDDNERNSPQSSGRSVCSFRIYRVSTKPTSAGAKLVADTVDFEVIKEWIKCCDGARKIEENLNHSMNTFTLKADDAEQDFSLRVIDVHDCNIQELPHGARYFTLSYVWGGPQLFQSTMGNRHIIEYPKGLKIDTLPLTIQDAVKLVRNIGERYLWVDSLCIIQDDPIISVAHINAMDRIYEGSIATIIAITGNSANSGLLGMRPVKERFQHRQKVRDMTLVSSIMPIPLEEKRSVWSTRAWTFQEYQLSRYCIEFGLDGVNFYYNSGTRMRSMHRKSYDSGTRSEQFLQPKWTGPTNPRALLYEKLESVSNFTGYNSLLKDYSKREMSLTTDVLNAFAGIVSRLRPLFRSDFIFGLPAAEIDTGLLWLPTGPLKRRTHPTTGVAIFPSWSWCGWVGEVDYDLRYGLIDTVSVLSWIDPVASKNFESDDLRGRPASKSHWREVSPEGTRAPVYFEETEPKTLYDHPIEPEAQRPSIHLVAPGSQNLQFKTMVAEFPISRWRIPCDSPDKSHSEFGLFTFDGFLAGCFVTASDAIPKNEFVIQEVIALSKIKREHRQLQPRLVVGHSKGSSGPSYNHLTLPLKPYPVEVAESSSPKLTEDQLPSLNELIISRYKDWILFEKQGGNVVSPKCPFDIDVFDMDLPYLFYNIMVIEWKQGVAYRVGIGICHIDAFHRGNPVRKTIVLG